MIYTNSNNNRSLETNYTKYNRVINYGFVGGFGAAGGDYGFTSGVADVCIVIMGTSGDWRGHIAGTGSEITPGYTYEGEEIYEYKWNIVTGEFIIAFGSAGDTELENVRGILIEHPKVPDRNVAIFDETDKRYEFTDLELAQLIAGDVEQACFDVLILPYVLIYYNYATISVGTGE